jgi:hypothetical protein
MHHILGGIFYNTIPNERPKNYENMKVLQLGLQLHFLIIMTTCNSSYKYGYSCVKQVALVVIYMT